MDSSKTPSPTALPVFRPQATDDPDLLERTLCGRRRLADQLTTRARESVLGKGRHQQFVHGPRGSGKTHLLTVVYHRLRRDPALRDRMVLVRLAEEQWEIASFLDLIVQILRRMAEAYPGLLPPDWEDRLHALPPSARQAAAPVASMERVALGLLRDALGDRVLVLLLENLDDLFAALEEDGQCRLRAHIQEVDNWCLLASAQTLLRDLVTRSRPFFGFFQPHALEPLDVEHSHTFLRRLAEDPAVGNPSLARVLATAEGAQRVRVIHLLCGGNHRLLTMLYPFLNGESLVDLVEPFLRLIDRELTPYYQERLRWLSSAQQRKLVTWLARQEQPLPMKAVARGCLITEQVASGQLRKLAEAGFVRLLRKGRETYCEIHEPLLRFVLDFQEHRKGAVRTIVRVLRVWYSAEELRQLAASPRIREVAVYRESVQAALSQMSPAVAEPAVEEELGELLEAGKYEELLAQVAGLPPHQGRRGGVLWREARALIRLGRWEEAEERYQTLAATVGALREPEARASGLFALGYLGRELGWPEAARASFEEALGIYRELAAQRPEVYRPYVAGTLNNLGLVQRDLNELEAARASFEEGLGIYRELAAERPEVYRPYVAMTLNNLGILEREQGSYPAAVDRFGEAFELRRTEYRRRPNVHRDPCLRTGLGWLAALRLSGEARRVVAAWAEVADTFPPGDPIRLVLTLATRFWSRDWRQLERPLSPEETAAAGQLSAEERSVIGKAFAELLPIPEVSVDRLRGALSSLPAPLQRACQEQAMARAPALLRRESPRPPELVALAGRMREVFDDSDAVRKAAGLLEVGAAYLESDRDEAALLKLPVEQRRLLIETCGPPRKRLQEARRRPAR